MIELIQRAKARKGRVAIRSNDTDYTYGDLLAQSERVASFLLGNKMDLKEERIAFLISPSYEYVVAQWAIWRAGGIAVPLCDLHPAESMKYVLENTKASLVLTENSYVGRLEGMCESLDVPLIDVADIENSKVGMPMPDLDQQRRAMILYTSGTTALPKGVVTTHGNISSQILTLVKAWSWSSDDQILNILPLHHVHGIINILGCALWAGACCEFMPKFEVGTVFNRLSDGDLNLFMAVPTIYYKLIQHWEDQELMKRSKFSKSLKTYRLNVSGSAALPESVLEKWKSITGQILLERYGMTEIGMALSNPYHGERRPGHVGLPLPHVSVRLVDDVDAEVEPGREGEIQVKGPSVFTEYWNNPTATQDAFSSDGWFRTGDVAILSNGYYKILGRSSVDIIKSGGYKISALEIESVLLRHDHVAQCAVVGILDEEWGEVVGSVVVANSDEASQDELIEFLRDKLPAYKIPRKWKWSDSLPRNALGKVLKNEVKKYF